MNHSAEPELTLEAAQQVLAAQPFSVLIGARVASFSRGEAILDIDVRHELLQQNGFVHGGVLSYGADNALTFAGGSVLGAEVLTGGFAITYVRPGRGRRLRAHAQVLHAGTRQAVCRCELYALDNGSEPTLCAIAQGTITSTRR